MPKYSRVLTSAEVEKCRQEDKELAAKMAQAGIKPGMGGASYELALPQDIKDALPKGDDGKPLEDIVEGLGRCMTVMLDVCCSSLIPKLPLDVRKRMRPSEVIGELMDDVVEYVYGIAFREAGRPTQYDKSVDLTMALGGDIGPKIAAVMICSNVHKRLVDMAKDRADLPDIDPALAAKATHREHATVN